MRETFVQKDGSTLAHRREPRLRRSIVGRRELRTACLLGENLDKAPSQRWQQRRSFERPLILRRALPQQESRWSLRTEDDFTSARKLWPLVAVGVSRRTWRDSL